MRQIERGDTLTASEASLKYGLDYKVIKKAHGMDAPNSGEHVAIVREDTGEIFQFAKQGYEPLQCAEAMQECDKLIGTGQAKYVNGGTYKGGRVFWLRIAVPSGDFETTPGDLHKTYLNVVSSHDGSKRFTIVPEVYRMICSNGMHAWVNDGERIVAVKHTVNARAIFTRKASEILAKELHRFKVFAEKTKALAQKQMSQLEIDSFLFSLFNVTQEDIDSKEKGTGKVEAQIDKVKDLCQVGTGIREHNLQGTAYGVYNAVTEYIGKYRSTRGSEENRDYSELFTSGKDLREKAFEMLLKA